MPGTIPATSQLDRLISMTAINVLAGSRAMRDRLKLFNVCMGSSIGSQRTMDAISTPPPHSIFRLEVGFASLGFALVGLLAFRGSFDLRLAAIVGPAGFLWGAAGVHVYQMITQHNFAPGNAGIIFYSDILVPIVGFIFLWLQHRAARSQRRSSA